MEITELIIAIKTTSALKLQTGERDPGWKAGEVVEGIILEKLAEYVYLLKADGKEFTILSPYTLTRNQTITMEILGRQDDRYTTKLLNANPIWEEDKIKKLIDKIGVRDTPINRALIQGILAQEVPLKTETLQKAQSILKMLSGSFPEDIEAALLALKWDLPPKPRVLEVLQAFISGLRENERGSESQLFRLIRQLGYLLNEAPENITGNNRNAAAAPPSIEQSPSLPVSEDGIELLRQVRDLLEAIILKPEDGREKLAEQLRSLLASQLPSCREKSGTLPFKPAADNTAMNPGVPNHAASLPAEGAHVQEIQPNSPFQYGAHQAAEAENSPVFPYTIKPSAEGKQEQAFNPNSDEKLKSPAERQIPLESGRWNKTEGKETNHRTFSNLLEKFSRLLTELRASVKEAGAPPFWQELLLKGESIEKQMAGQQIFQSMAGENNRQDYFYFNIPFISYGETETWGQLKILKNTGGKKTIDPECFSLAILLNTANLGPLVMEINVVNRDVKASVKVAEDWVARVFYSAWPKLQESFNSIGYTLHQCSCKVGALRASLQPRGFHFLGDTESLHLLDITV